MSYLLRLFEPRIKYKVTAVTEFPAYIEKNKVYIVGEKKCKWVAVFKCPCNCDSLVQLNLLKNGDYQWRIRIDKGKVSISPSIYRKFACQSHFSIVNGNLEWF